MNGELNTGHSFPRHSVLLEGCRFDEPARVPSLPLGSLPGLQSTFGVFATRAHLRQKKRGELTRASNSSVCFRMSRLDQSQRVFAMGERNR
jgi:hypothetical protein